MFDWINALAADTTLTAKAVGTAVVVIFIVFHAIASRMSLARIIVASISGAIVLAIIFGGIDFLAAKLRGEMI